jgi:membrane protein implicated in regulation of membrane protease activity
MFKFLPGIILIQLVTGALVVMALNWSQDFQLVIVITMIAFFSAILTAFWFSSIARNIHHDQQTTLRKQHAQDRENFLKVAGEEKVSAIKEKSQMQDMHARERERILLNTEREKSNIMAASYKKIEQETRKAHAKANFKVGAAFATAVGAGGIMIFSQLVTVGVMFLVASGSGLSCYILRARQERLTRNKQTLINDQRLLIEQTDSNKSKDYP